MMKELTAKQRADLFKEIREDEAAAKLEDEHGRRTNTEAYRKFLEAKARAPEADKAEDRGVER
jgi:hypothetical protein